MDNLFHLSTVACEVERLGDGHIKEDVPSSSGATGTTSAAWDKADATKCSDTTEKIDPVSKTLNNRPCDQIRAVDRSAIKEKLKIAFQKKSNTYEDLLELCVALTEEQVYSGAPSKLDYYKQGITLVKKILERSLDTEEEKSVCQSASGAPSDMPRAAKRAKTQH